LANDPWQLLVPESWRQYIVYQSIVKSEYTADELIGTAELS